MSTFTLTYGKNSPPASGTVDSLSSPSIMAEEPPYMVAMSLRSWSLLPRIGLQRARRWLGGSEVGGTGALPGVALGAVVLPGRQVFEPASR